MNALPDDLLVVTDRLQTRQPLPAVIEAVLEAGARWIWFRDRDLPPDDRWALAKDILTLVRQRGGTLMIGGDIALAVEIGADGVQLADLAAIPEARKRLGQTALIGFSAHSVKDCALAAHAGADYVCLSPIFETPSKPGYGPALGIAALKVAAVHLPIVALGGMNPERAMDCWAASASAIAVMGEIMRSKDPGETFGGFRTTLTKNSADRHPR